jgi:hypothetical protein
MIWEYDVRELRVDASNTVEEMGATLREAGTDGWELVAVVPSTVDRETKAEGSQFGSYTGHVEHGFDVTRTLLAFLKRPV